MTLPMEMEIDILQKRCEYMEKREQNMLDLIQSIVNAMQDMKFQQRNSDDKIMNIANQRTASAARKGNKYSIFILS